MSSETISTKWSQENKKNFVKVNRYKFFHVKNTLRTKNYYQKKY